MHFRYAPHVHDPADLTILKCRCGWVSSELTREQAAPKPWYCDRCNGQGLSFVTFHPDERAEAYRVLGLVEPSPRITDRLWGA